MHYLICNVNSALVWGTSVKHNPQSVGKDHVLHDEDVVQIVKKSVPFLFITKLEKLFQTLFVLFLYKVFKFSLSKGFLLYSNTICKLKLL